MKLTTLIAALMLLATPAHATYYHPPVYYPPVVTPPVEPPTPTHGQPGGGNWHLCPTPAGIFICVVVAGIVVHEVLGPKCAKPGLKNGYDTPTLWRPLCNWKDPISVRW